MQHLGVFPINPVRDNLGPSCLNLRTTDIVHLILIEP
jgi:hypothetical protein